MTKNAKLQRSVIETSADGEEGLEWTRDLERHNESSSRLQFCCAGKLQGNCGEIYFGRPSPKKMVAHKEGGIAGKSVCTWTLGAPNTDENPVTMTAAHSVSGAIQSLTFYGADF